MPFDPALVHRAALAVPVLAEHAAETERLGRPTEESRAAALRAGAYALTTPRRFGGEEASLETIVAVLAELGRGCASTAWTAATSVEAQRFFGPLFTEEQAAMVYADPDLQLAGAGAPPGTAVIRGDHAVVTGRWNYATGIDDASWALIGGTLLEDGQAVGFGAVLARKDDLRIERTWHVAGLQGTGSHTVVATDLEVPMADIVRIPLDANGAPDIGDRPYAFLTNPLVLLGPMVGAVRGAIDLIAERLPVKSLPRSRQSLAETPEARLVFAQAVAAHADAERTVRSLAALIDAGSTTPDAAELAAHRYGLAEAGRSLRRAMDLLLDLGGTSVFRDEDPVQRIWRDVSVGTRHATLHPIVAAAGYADALVAH